MDDNLDGKRIAIVATDYFEESELTSPLTVLQNAGAEVDVIAPHTGEIKGLKHLDPGEPVPVDKVLENADPDDYDALILPGGVVNADQLRMNRQAQQFVKDFFDKEKLVAAICHGPWLLVSAGIIQDRQLTSYYTLQDDIRNAGAEWVDEEVVVENNLITSRKPDDLPAFNQAIIEYLVEN